MSGAIKGVSEETASLVAGQMNAIRINQLENAQVLQQQLVQVTNIADSCRAEFGAGVGRIPDPLPAVAPVLAAGG